MWSGVQQFCSRLTCRHLLLMQLNNEGVQKSIFAALKEDPNFAKFLEHVPVSQLPLLLRNMSSPA